IAPVYCGYVTILNGDNLVILYNDDARNLKDNKKKYGFGSRHLSGSYINKVILDAEGNTKQEIFTAEGEHTPLRAGETHLLDDEHCIFSFRKNSEIAVKIVKLR